MADDRLMVDLETLGTEPGAAIASIGAVRFSVADGIGDEFSASVSLADCQAHGMRIDAETLSWWLNQPATARDQLHGGRGLEAALRAFIDFASGASEVWANSPAFDAVILRDAADRVGLGLPWQYYQERDYRTLRETLSTWPDREQSGTTHDALDDARYQADQLVAALRAAGDADD